MASVYEDLLELYNEAKTAPMSEDTFASKMAMILLHHFMENTGASFVDLISNQNIDGIKTFLKTIVGDITGNSGTVTNGVYTEGNQSINGDKTFKGLSLFSSLFGLQVVYSDGVEDGIKLLGREGGTESRRVTLVPGELSGNRTYTLPDVGSDAIFALFQTLLNTRDDFFERHISGTNWGTVDWVGGSDSLVMLNQVDVPGISQTFYCLKDCDVSVNLKIQTIGNGGGGVYLYESHDYVKSDDFTHATIFSVAGSGTDYTNENSQLIRFRAGRSYDIQSGTWYGTSEFSATLTLDSDLKTIKSQQPRKLIEGNVEIDGNFSADNANINDSINVATTNDRRGLMLSRVNRRASISLGANGQFIFNFDGVFHTQMDNAGSTNFSKVARFYSGSSLNHTNFPIGHIIGVTTGTNLIDRNAATTIRLHTSSASLYTIHGSGSILSGTWRARGYIGPTSSYRFHIFQRVS